MMNAKTNAYVLVLCIAAGIATSAVAANSNPTLENLADVVGAGTVESWIAGYDGTQPIGIGLNWAGMPLQIDYPVENGSLLRFQIADLGVNLSFQGESRADSRNQLRNYLLQHAELLDRLQNVSANRSSLAIQQNMLPAELTGQADTYNYDFDTQLAYHAPVLDRAELGLTVGAGASSISEMGVSTQSVRAHVAGGIRVPLEQWDVLVSSGVGFAQAGNLRVNGVTVDMQSTGTSALQNGITLQSSVPLRLGQEVLNFSYYAVDSRYTNNDLYGSYRDEIGMTVIGHPTHGQQTSSLQGGVAYIWSQQNRTVNLNFGYRF